MLSRNENGVRCGKSVMDRGMQHFQALSSEFAAAQINVTQRIVTGG
jgi:hypothetical protein